MKYRDESLLIITHDQRITAMRYDWILNSAVEDHNPGATILSFQKVSIICDCGDASSSTGINKKENHLRSSISVSFSRIFAASASARRTGTMGVVEEAQNVKIIGGGQQTVVLGHGFGTDQSVWKHLIPHLVDDYKVVLYDNIGAGTTNPDYFDFERYRTLEGFAYDLLGILEELRIDSCVFVGHSVSAMIGAVASITRPDLFQKIIMISPSPRYFHFSFLFAGGMKLNTPLCLFRFRLFFFFFFF